MSRRPVLRVGRRTRPLGTGVHRGWGDAEDWIIDEDRSIVDIEWKDSSYRCNDCGYNLRVYSVPCGFHFQIYICENGHRFYYENTD